MEQNTYMTQGTYPNQQNNNAYYQLHDAVETAFSKGLAATIMSQFPIVSIIAIFFGSTALKNQKYACELGSYYGMEVPGKNTAAKVLGKIGLICGIAYTAFWALYGVWYFFMLLLAFL